MALIKKNELMQMNAAQLKSKLDDLRKELIKMNAQISTGTPPENPGQVKEIKKTIARILTILKSKRKMKKFLTNFVIPVNCFIVQKL